MIDPLAGRASRRARITYVVLYNVVLAVFPIMALFALHTANEQKYWKAFPCEIVGSGITRDTDEMQSAPYQAVITYQFFIDGEYANGHDDDHHSDNAASMDAITRRFPSGMRTTCWIDPNDHHRTTLVRSGTRYAWLVIGGSVIVFVLMWWLYCLPELREIPVDKMQEENRRSDSWAGYAMVLLGAIYAAWLCVIPLIRNVRAARWPSVPCTVESRHVLASRAKEVMLYRPDVLYRYVVNGIEYHSNCYSKTDLSMPIYSGGKQKIADTVLSGDNAVCFVNPDDPADAVITTAISPTIVFILLPIAVMLLGWQLIRRHRRRYEYWIDELREQRTAQFGR